MSAAVIYLHEFEHPCSLCGVLTRVEFLERADAYESTCCPECFDAVESELHRTGCVCRHCLARRAAFAARLRLEARRKAAIERERLRAEGVLVVDADGNEDIGF